MATTHDPIDFVCGDTWALNGLLQDAAGAAINLVGATMTWKLDDLLGVNKLTLSLGSGITVTDFPTAAVLIKATPTQTVALLPGSYQDWLRVTLADGTVFTEWTGIIRAAPNPN
jgi:hypothetical protein